jgi:hypothetical protein
MTEQNPTPEGTRPNIYLGTDGAYHDDTDANREQFPAAEDQVEPDAEPADADRTPDTRDPATGVAPGADTVTPAGDQAGSDATSTPAGPAAPDQTGSSKTRK